MLKAKPGCSRLAAVALRNVRPVNGDVAASASLDVPIREWVAKAPGPDRPSLLWFLVYCMRASAEVLGGRKDREQVAVHVDFPGDEGLTQRRLAALRQQMCAEPAGARSEIVHAGGSAVDDLQVHPYQRRMANAGPS